MAYKFTDSQIETVVGHGSRLLAEYCIADKIHYVITGSSGGLDSAVTLGFAQKACRIAAEQDFSLTSLGLIMPCESTPESEELGREANRKFGAKEIHIDLTPTFISIYGDPDSEGNEDDTAIFPIIDTQIRDILSETNGLPALKNFDKSSKVAQGNIKARLRMIAAYHVARMMGGMVLSTDNLSEHWMGFWTICGDVGDFGIIQQILKGLELYDIARYLGVPQRIIDSRPDDGLGVTSGGDEAQLGAPYPVLDRVMITLIQRGFDPEGSIEQLKRLPHIDGVAPEVVQKLAGRCLHNSFKRKGTVVLSREKLGLPELRSIEL